MGIVYQLTFLAGLGLIAVVIAVFVLAASQVGKATESAASEQKDMLSKQKTAKEKQIEIIEGKLKEAKKAGHLDSGKLIAELDRTKKEIDNYDIEIKEVQKSVVLLRRKGAVVYPGIGFITTLVLSMTASGLEEGKIFSTLALWLWVISIGTLVFGVSRIFKTLGAIENVTITSGEALDKLPDAVKSAIMQVEAEKKPELQFQFRGEKPPFGFKVEEEKIIKFGIRLTKGVVAKGCRVAFFAPSGFDFPGAENMVKQPEDIGTVGGYMSSIIDVGNCAKPAIEIERVKIKAPDKAKGYTLFYRLSCDEGFDSGYVKFKVKVEGRTEGK